MSVHPIEGIWLLVNLVGVGVAAWLLWDALADRRAIKAANGRAREIVGNGAVRREVLRFVISLLLASVVVPGLYVDREIMLSPVLIALMTVPFLIGANGLLDMQERRRLAGILETDIANERRQKIRVQDVHDAQDARGVVQDARGVIQDERDAAQDARDKAVQ